MWIFLIVFLFVLSLVVSIRIKFNNFKLISIFKCISKDKTSLFLTLGTKIGVGSIVGTASSILIGGISSVIWMIIFSIICTSLIYYESYLGIKYRKKINNDFVGGPYYTIKYGLKNNVLANISLIILIITYSFLFQMIQTNTISNIILLNININKIILILFFFIILVVTISFSIKDVISVMNKIVPFMCLIFLITCLSGIIKNIDTLFLAFKDLNLNLFSTRSILVGLIIGVKRSIFMNEILVGTTSVSSATDKNEMDVSISLQLVGVYFITLVVSVLMSLLAIIYMHYNISSGDYINLINNIFMYTNGKLGIYLLIIILVMFGFTTILSGYYIAKSNIEYIFKNKHINLFKILFILITLSGMVFDNSIIWKVVDFFIFIMIIINSYSIIKLLGSEKYDRK